MRALKLIMIVALSATATLMSCKSKSAKDLIVNKWKVTAVSDDKADPDKKMSESEKQEMVGKTTLEFSKDGKCSITSGSASPETGTYSVADDGKTLLMTQSGSEHADTMKIEEISDGKMVISEAKSKMTITMSKQ